MDAGVLEAQVVALERLTLEQSQLLREMSEAMLSLAKGLRVVSAQVEEMQRRQRDEVPTGWPGRR